MSFPLTKNALYIVKPNIQGYKNFFKLGKASSTGSRLGNDYSTYWPLFLGGFSIYGILNVASDRLAQKEAEMHTLASQFNFRRVTEPRMTEFFEYRGPDIYTDARKLLLAVRARGFGTLYAFAKGGHRVALPRRITSYGNEMDTGRIKRPFHMPLRGKRQYVAADGGVRALHRTTPRKRYTEF